MDSYSNSDLLIYASLALGWLLPIAHIALDKRAHFKERAVWIFAVLFVSWFAWLLYVVVAPLFKPDAKQGGGQ